MVKIDKLEMNTIDDLLLLLFNRFPLDTLSAITIHYSGLESVNFKPHIRFETKVNSSISVEKLEEICTKIQEDVVSIQNVYIKYHFHNYFTIDFFIS